MNMVKPNTHAHTQKYGHVCRHTNTHKHATTRINQTFLNTGNEKHTKPYAYTRTGIKTHTHTPTLTETKKNTHLHAHTQTYTQFTTAQLGTGQT